MRVKDGIAPPLVGFLWSKGRCPAVLTSQCIPHPELPGTSALFRDYLYDFQRVKGFYRYDPNDPAAVRQAAAGARIPEDRRRAVVAALRRINGPSTALEALERPETVAVVTGQQVSLFGGPCYALYKALTAVKLARQLTANGIPAAPVFWMATEDHDLAEADHCWVFGPDRQPRRLGAHHIRRDDGAEFPAGAQMFL